MRILDVKSNRSMPTDSRVLDEMHLAPTERVALFIDGAELHAMSRALGFEIDFTRLLDLFRRKGRLVRANYYTVLIDNDPLRPLVDWLDYNGFATVTKHTKESRSFARPTMHMELAVDAMLLAESLDHIVIVSGHADLHSLIAMLQGQGKRVSVLSTLASRPPMIADELRRQADQFIDLKDLENEIRR